MMMKMMIMAMTMMMTMVMKTMLMAMIIRIMMMTMMIMMKIMMIMMMKMMMMTMLINMMMMMIMIMMIMTKWCVSIWDFFYKSLKRAVDHEVVNRLCLVRLPPPPLLLHYILPWQTFIYAFWGWTGNLKTFN